MGKRHLAAFELFVSILERLRGSHSHPASWNEDMREVLVRFSNEGDISKLCVCKADELSIRRGVRGSSEFTPRNWCMTWRCVTE